MDTKDFDAEFLKETMKLFINDQELIERSTFRHEDSLENIKKLKENVNIIYCMCIMMNNSVIYHRINSKRANNS